MQKETLDILKNFASINQGIIFREGNVIRTMSVLKNVFARATIPDTFAQEFAIYDLNEFLSTLSLFQSPEISYKDDHIEIKSGRSRARYYYSNPKVIVAPPHDKNIEVTGDLSFKLPASVLEQTLKASSVMKLKELEITDQGLRAFDKSGTSSNQYNVDVENLQGTGGSKVVKIENLKLLPRDYTVVVGERAIKFTSIDEGLVYFVVVESE